MTATDAESLRKRIEAALAFLDARVESLSHGTQYQAIKSIAVFEATIVIRKALNEASQP